ncbi:hypothetical protein Nepgr_032680 [Nepenthes gracilis]|uniref:Carbohydrate kinase PfkB domain-containing protein n=1 Tax=Nepenthes gracilis TaxID=150966 RepID=A0AAD3Y5Y3_NEPGR|nr:hypothetical protein Nepgr_032680 [Nepenthes gracilis]
MNHLTQAAKSPIFSNALPPLFPLLPRNTDPIGFTKCPTNFSQTLKFSVPNCKGNENTLLNNRCNSTNFSNGSVRAERLRSVAAKDIDVATLGNLCVDIVLNVPQLPPTSFEGKKAYMEQLSLSPPDKRYWEAGGNCNTAIAAARLGLNCVAIGHVGNEIYGHFLLDVLRNEGIGMVGMSKDLDAVQSSCAAYETLLCWVLVDPLQRHGFCSRADFSREPALSWLNELTEEVKIAIKRSKVLFVNGYGFDELSPSLIVSALKYAVEVGTSVFFDPGPRGRSLCSGTLEEQSALSEFLKMSDVLLLTSDEAEALTGIGNPVLAGQELLKRSSRTQWVVVKMGSKGSILITLLSISYAPTFKIKIVDTVGCGDSFVAAIAFGFVHKMPMAHTLVFANAVGAATAMGCGAGRNVATLEQVTALIEFGDLNEDEKFWREILSEDSDVQEITLLSQRVVNGSNGRLNCLSLEKVIPELMSKLKSRKVEGVLPT